MEHTKKFVLVDPRFVRPSMRDKALSELDVDISSILKSDEPDEIKVRNYMTALSRYKNYSSPPKSTPPPPPETPQPPPALPAVPPVLQFKVTTPSKRSGKRVKIEPLSVIPHLIHSCGDVHSENRPRRNSDLNGLNIAKHRKNHVPPGLNHNHGSVYGSKSCG